MGKYRVQDESASDDFEAADYDAALAYAEEWLRTGSYDVNTTLWLDAHVFSLTEDGECDERLGSVEVTLHPEQPKCEEESHEWCSPYDLLGGLKENPGVWGNGGGVIIREVCKHCGVKRVTNTWAQNPCTGEQGLTSVEYLDAGPAELEWVESHRKEGE
jgi:hypothetical protein